MNKKIKKELREWLIMLSVFGILYITGWYVEVIGLMQRGILEIGLMKPEKIELAEQKRISYDFELVDINGETVSFNDFKNKTVFFNLWATWCMPCIAEMPDIDNLYQKVDRNKIAFVLISRNDKFEKAIEFVERKGYSFPIYKAKGELPRELSSNTIPTTFVISPKGMIAARRTGMAKYNTEDFKEFLEAL